MHASSTILRLVIHCTRGGDLRQGDDGDGILEVKELGLVGKGKLSVVAHCGTVGDSLHLHFLLLLIGALHDCFE